jgi:hypothetical protein
MNGIAKNWSDGVFDRKYTRKVHRLYPTQMQFKTTDLVEFLWSWCMDAILDNLGGAIHLVKRIFIQNVYELELVQ